MKKLLIFFAVIAIGIESNAQINWEDVEVANFESEVTDLVKRGMVTSKAKGMTTLSSQGKMQTRAINKLKMVTAMIGGSTVLIMDQQTQSAQSGGWYGGTNTTAGANISGVAYADEEIKIDQFVEGVYVPEKAYYMGPNHTSIQPALNVSLKMQVRLNKSMIKEVKRGIELNQYFEVYSKYNSTVWDVTKIEDDRIYLSSVFRTRGGKETYMTIILLKKASL